MAINKQQLKNESLATIDAALTILNKFPALDNAMDISFSGSHTINPLDMIMDLFIHTDGYDVVVEKLSKYIAFFLPELDNVVKGVIASSLKDILSCSLNPHMTEDILRNGITISVDELCLIDTFKYSPLDKTTNHGANFYFGCENMKTVDELRYATDLDALLWYVINCANHRVAWRIDQANGKDADTGPESAFDEKNRTVCTFDFAQHAESLLTADGKQLKSLNPYQNLIQVFIGDATENKQNKKIKELNKKEDDAQTNDKNINDNENEIKIKNAEIEKLQKDIEKLEADYENQVYQDNEKKYETEHKKLERKLTTAKNELLNLQDESKVLKKEKRKINSEISKIKKDIRTLVVTGVNEGLQENEQLFSDIKKNFYAAKALVQFNIDYLKSVHFFDRKVVIARLLNALTGIGDITVNLSFRQQLVRQEIKKMVTEIIESDDITISDCFFKFSNEDYDRLSREAELKKAGIMSVLGNQVSAAKINVDDVMDSLNSINPQSSKETVQTVIKGSLTNIAKTLSSTTDKTNIQADWNIISLLLEELAYTLTTVIFSPKVYLLLLINIKLMDGNTSFSIEEFFERFNEIIAQLIRKIRDHLIQYLVKEIISRVKEIAEQIGIQFAIEQMKYYKKLLKQIIDCFKFKGGEGEFNIDNVDYADIYQIESEPITEEC